MSGGPGWGWRVGAREGKRCGGRQGGGVGGREVGHPERGFRSLRV